MRDRVPGVDHVSLGLGHLLTLCVQDHVVDDHVPERRAHAQHRADREQGVEPASGLVERLADEVGREVCAEGIIVLVRPVPLGVGHRSGVEPDVQNRGVTAHRSPALLTRPHELVDVGSMGVEALTQVPCPARELGDGADPLDVRGIRFTYPHGKRRAPEAIARKRPVHVVRQPISEPPLPHLGGVPRDRIVVREQMIAERGRGREPGVAGHVEERRGAAPTVWIGMRDRVSPKQPALRLQPLEEERIGVLHERSADDGDPLVEVATVIHRTEQREVVPLTRFVVICPEGWS